MSKSCIIDLETGGLVPGSAIFSIGAVAVDLATEEITSHFYKVIDKQDAAKHGTLDPDTMLWWGRQSAEAREAIFGDKIKKEKLFDVLDQFKSWFVDSGCEKPWGNGATFDISQIEHYFHYFGLTIPWSYWNVRDLRTLGDFVGQDVKDDLVFEGIKHHALHDAFHEAKYASRMWQIGSAAIKQFREHN